MFSLGVHADLPRKNDLMVKFLARFQENERFATACGRPEKLRSSLAAGHVSDRFC